MKTSTITTKEGKIKITTPYRSFTAQNGNPVTFYRRDRESFALQLAKETNRPVRFYQCELWATRGGSIGRKAGHRIVTPEGKTYYSSGLEEDRKNFENILEYN